MRDWLKLQSSGGTANSLFRVSRFFQENFFITKDGHIGLAFSVRGIDPSSVTSEMLDAYSKALFQSLRSLPEEIRIYQYMVKRESGAIQTEEVYPSKAVAETVRARNAAVESKGLYSIDLVWVFVYERDALLSAKKTKSVRAGQVLRVLLSSIERDAAILLARTQAFIDETKTQLGAQLLSRSEMFWFFRRLANLEDSTAYSLGWTPDDLVDNFLLDETPTVHRSGIALGEQSIQILSTREAVARTSPNLLREVLETKCGVILCLEYKRVSIHRANTEAANAENHFQNAAFLSTAIGLLRLVMARGNTALMSQDSAAKKNEKEVGHVQERLNAGDSLGHFSATILLHSSDPEKLRQATADTIRSFGRAGGSLYRETYNSLNAYRSIMPGGSASNFRRLWMLQSNVADMSLMYAPSAGDRRNKFLNREYLFVAETNSQTAHFHNLHHGDVCNAFMAGLTGAGKSVASNAHIDHLQKYSPRTLILDIGGSYKHTCQKHGGSYAALDLSANKKWFINPLSLEGTAENIEFLESFVRLLLTNSNQYTLTNKDDRIIHEAVGEIYEKREGKRQLSNLKLPEHLTEALYNWIGNGPYARVFDNPEDTISFSNFQVFDLQGLERYPRVLEPLFFYIFLRQQMIVEDPKLRSTFKLLWADEVWRFLENETCKRQFVSAAKTYRKHNAGLGLVTQSSFDLKRVGLLEVISEICPTKIFLHNPSADFGAYAEMFHLNAAEVENFKNLISKKQFFVKKAEEPGVVLNLNLSPAELAMYGNSPLENEKRDAAIEKYGWEEGMRQLAAAV